MKYLTLLFVVTAFSYSHGGFKQAPEEETQFLIFNIQKTSNSYWDQEVFENLVSSADYSLIQEAIVELDYPIQSYEYNFYLSWGDTGVATLSQSGALKTLKLVSPSTEPFVATPKVTSIETYFLKGTKETLMVANIHALNFKSLSSFMEQIDQVAKVLENHEGPLIWAGDFNTWNSSRKSYLVDVAHKLGLKEVKFENRNETFFELDHAFIRQMDIVSAKQLSIDISDHRPLELIVNIK